MTQPRAYDPDIFLDQVTRAFWSRGYGATSLSDLVAATGVHRGSIYTAYRGKRDLFLACLRRYDARHRRDFLAGLGRRLAPRAAILAAFEAAAGLAPNHPPASAPTPESAAASSPPPGCLLVNTAIELGPHDPEIAAQVSASLAEVEAFFADRLLAGIRDGSLSAALPVTETATALMGLFLGLRVLARSGAAPGARVAMVAQARALLTPPDTKTSTPGETAE